MEREGIISIRICAGAMFSLTRSACAFFVGTYTTGVAIESYEYEFIRVSSGYGITSIMKENSFIGAFYWTKVHLLRTSSRHARILMVTQGRKYNAYDVRYLRQWRRPVAVLGLWNLSGLGRLTWESKKVCRSHFTCPSTVRLRLAWASPFIFFNPATALVLLGSCGHRAIRRPAVIPAISASSLMTYLADSPYYRPFDADRVWFRKSFMPAIEEKYGALVLYCCVETCFCRLLSTYSSFVG